MTSAYNKDLSAVCSDFAKIIQSAISEQKPPIGFYVIRHLGGIVGKNYPASDGEFASASSWQAFFREIDSEIRIRLKNKRDFLESYAPTKDRGLTSLSRTDVNILSKWRVRKTATAHPDLAWACYFWAHICSDAELKNAAYSIDIDLMGGRFESVFDERVPSISSEAARLLEKIEIQKRSKASSRGKRVSYPKPFLLPDNYQYERIAFTYTKSLLIRGSQRTIAIYGAGGYGKSSLARELCNDADVREQYQGGIYWLEFGMRESDALKGRERYRDLSDAIERMLEQQLNTEDRPALPFKNSNQDIVSLLDYLPDEPILIVADDIWHASQSSWFAYLPKHVFLVLTTRIKSIAKQALLEIEIQKLTLEASYMLLTHGMEAPTPEQKRKLSAIAPKFNGWPLALNLANGVFKSRTTNTGTSIDRVIKRYEDFLNGSDILGWDTPQPDTAFNEKRQLFIGYCIQAGLQALDEESRPDLLYDLGVFPDDTDIPISVVADYWKHHPSHPVSGPKARALIDLFSSYSFLATVDDQHDTIRLHDEILAYLRQSHGAELPEKHRRLVSSFKSHRAGGWDMLATQHQYGWRNLLYHLEAQGFQNKADDLRTDFNWLKAKLEATDVISLLHDFQSPTISEDAASVGRAIGLSLPVLIRRPGTLAHQLFGRLGHLPIKRNKSLIRQIQNHSSFYPRFVQPHLTKINSELVRIAGHEDRITSASFNHSNTQIVTSSHDKTSRLWDARTGRELLWLKGHQDWVRTAAFNRDDSLILTASDDTTARIWCARTGRELRCLVGHYYSLLGAIFNHAGTIVATCSTDGTLRVWSVETAEQLHQLNSAESWTCCPSFSPSDDMLLAGTGDGFATIMDTQTGEEITRLIGHRSWLHSAHFDKLGAKAITASEDGTSRIWEVSSGKQIHLLRPDGMPLRDARFSPDGTKCITVSDGGGVVFWDVETGNEIWRLQGHKAGVRSAVFNDSGSCAVTASNDGTTCIWCTESSERYQVLTGHDGSVNSAVFANEGNRILTVSSDRTVRLWAVEKRSGQAIISVSNSPIKTIEFSKGGSRLLTTSKAGPAKIWDTNSGKLLYSLNAKSNRVNIAKFSEDGRKVIASDVDHIVHVWETDTGARLLSLRGHKAPILDACFSHDSSKALTVSLDNTARFWDLGSGEELRRLQDKDNEFYSSSLNPPGATIVKAHFEPIGRLWSIEFEGQVQDYKSSWPKRRVHALYGRTKYLSAHSGQLVSIWNKASGAQLCDLDVSSMELETAIFNEKETVVIIALKDRTVGLWDAESGVCRWVVDFDSRPTCLAIFGDLIAVGMNDGEVNILK